MGSNRGGALCTKLFSLVLLVMATTTAHCTNALPLWAQRAGGARGGDPEPLQLMSHARNILNATGINPATASALPARSVAAQHGMRAARLRSAGATSAAAHKASPASAGESGCAMDTYDPVLPSGGKAPPKSGCAKCCVTGENYSSLCASKTKTCSKDAAKETRAACDFDVFDKIVAAPNKVRVTPTTYFAPALGGNGGDAKAHRAENATECNNTDNTILPASMRVTFAAGDNAKPTLNMASPARQDVVEVTTTGSWTNTGTTCNDNTDGNTNAAASGTMTATTAGDTVFATFTISLTIGLALLVLAQPAAPSRKRRQLQRSHPVIACVLILLSLAMATAGNSCPVGTFKPQPNCATVTAGDNRRRVATKTVSCGSTCVCPSPSYSSSGDRFKV